MSAERSSTDWSGSEAMSEKKKTQTQVLAEVLRSVLEAHAEEQLDPLQWGLLRDAYLPLLDRIARPAPRRRFDEHGRVNLEDVE